MGRANILLAVLVCLVSCESDRVFEAYRGMESGEWAVHDTVRFDPIIRDQNIFVVLGVKYNNDYGFRNLFVRYAIKDSLHQTLDTKLMDVPLFESGSGRPLGKGFGATFTKYDTLPIGQAFARIDLLQYMRIDTLDGIEAIGVKVIRK